MFPSSVTAPRFVYPWFAGGLSHPDECSSGSWNTESSHETSKHKFEDHACCYSVGALALVFQFKSRARLTTYRWQEIIQCPAQSRNHRAAKYRT